MAVARHREGRDKDWLPRLRRLLFCDSTWLAARSRPLLCLLGAMIVVLAVGAAGKRSHAGITQRYIGPTLPRVPFRLDEAIRLVRFSGDGTRVAAIGESGQGVVWSASGEQVGVLSFGIGTPKEMAVSEDGTLVTVGGSEGICTARVEKPGACVAKLPSGELLSGSVRLGLLAVGISNSTLNAQETLKDVARFSSRNVQRVLWSADGRGWFHAGGSAVEFRHEGARIDSGKRVTASGKAALDWRGEPVFGWDEVAGALSVSARGSSVLLATLVGGHSERRDFSSRVTALAFDPGSRRIAVGLEEGRVEFLEARLANRVNSADGLEYVWIPPGRFVMGCSPGDNECEPDEKPAHPVEITRGFWMGRTEVTQAAYRKVMGDNPSRYKGDNRPVETVDFVQAAQYCKKAGGMRLPAEAEWEYAARAGNPSARYGPLEAIAWYGNDSKVGTQGVGLLRPNVWGLHDMIGNVWEWTNDRHEAYSSAPAVVPAGGAAEAGRVCRGGSWFSVDQVPRVSYRVVNGPSAQFFALGFRCAGELR